MVAATWRVFSISSDIPCFLRLEMSVWHAGIYANRCSANLHGRHLACSEDIVFECFNGVTPERLPFRHRKGVPSSCQSELGTWYRCDIRPMDRAEPENGGHLAQNTLRFRNPWAQRLQLRPSQR